LAEITFEELVQMDDDGLDRVMRNGHPIDEEVLAGRLYEGVSLNLPKLVVKLSWEKFAKVFHREPDGSLRGWNCKIEQTPLSEPWVLQRKRGEPITYGFYAVRPCDAYRLPRPYDGGLMLDYGLGGNGRLDPTRNLRDPVVAVNEGDSTLLLGWSYVEIAGAQVGTPSFFALRRGAELEHTATAPRS